MNTMLLFSLLVASLALVDSAPMHSISKRQISPLAVGVTGLNPGMQYMRPLTGIYAGPMGGFQGSMVFGPPFMGPFNNPERRLERIVDIFDENRRINKRPSMADQFRLKGNFDDEEDEYYDY